MTRQKYELLSEWLLARGFIVGDNHRGDDGVRVGCSHCEALVINGVACHETGCPHARHECAGCNQLVPMNQRYCEDCQ